MSDFSPESQQAKLYCPITNLADSDLEEIFKRLPPHERLIVSESNSRQTHRRCRPVFAVRKSFDYHELICLTGAHGLSCVKFYACEFVLSAVEPDTIHDIFNAIFSDRLEHTTWLELTLHDARFRLSTGPSAKWALSAKLLPVSLRRLQLSGVSSSKEIVRSYIHGDGELLEGLERLQNLESFICHSGHKPEGPILSNCLTWDFISEIFCFGNREYNFYTKLSALANLKELCIGQAMHLDDDLCLSRISTSLPRLEVLFFNDILSEQDSDDVERLNELITKSAGLRILVLAGKYFDTDEAIELAARTRFPHGFGSDPLPLLHIFVGKVASEKIRFAKSASDAAIIHPINQPMPEFLGREDIAPIFEGVWLVEKIKEAAKHCGKLWDYEKYDTASSVQHC